MLVIPLPEWALEHGFSKCTGWIVNCVLSVPSHFRRTHYELHDTLGPDCRYFRICLFFQDQLPRRRQSVECPTSFMPLEYCFYGGFSHRLVSVSSHNLPLPEVVPTDHCSKYPSSFSFLFVFDEDIYLTLPNTGLLGPHGLSCLPMTQKIPV